jgi:hypothetical protein
MKKQLSYFPYNERSRSSWTLSTTRHTALSPIRSTIKTVTYVSGTFVILVPGPYKRGDWGDFPTLPYNPDLRPKLAPCGQSRPTPSYTCGTACGENKSSVCSSIGKNPSQTTSLIFMRRRQNSSSNSMALSIWSPANQNMTHNGPGIWSSKD